jgi:putative ABC transport system permease protein
MRYPAWLRAYRAALHLLPERVRERHGEQMVAVFGELLREARARRGRLGVGRAAMAELAGLVRFAARERRAEPLPRGVDERLYAWNPPDVRPERKPRMLASLSQDVRYALRTLLRSPSFTAICIATMALAIGANTAIFSVVDAILLERLPFPEPERLVLVGHREEIPTELGSTTPGNFYDWLAGTAAGEDPAFESMAAFGSMATNLTWKGSSQRVVGVRSAGSLFDVLGAPALHGRTFRSDEDGPGAERVVVLSHGLWLRLFGPDPSAVGKTLTLGGNPYLVLGVMPRGFAFPDSEAEYWIPARFDEEFRGNRDQYFLLAAARLAPGVSAEQARARLDTVMDRIRRAFPQETGETTAGVLPMKAALVAEVQTRLWTLMGAVLLILLISCANLGNLLLARAAGRRREIALRNALGARPARLVRQMLTESLLLAVAGGAAGLLLGSLLLDGLVALLPTDLPRSQEIGLDLRVLAFTLLVSLASGLAFGLFPSLQLAGRVPGDALRDGTRGSGRTRFARAGLVISEVALALMLLAGAGLLIRSFAKLIEVDPGFAPGRLLTFRVGVSPAAYDEPARAAFFAELEEKLRALPGVQAVARASDLPVTGYGSGAWFNLLDRPLPANETPPAIPYRVVGTGYLQAIGIPLLRGRAFNSGDRLDGTRAVIVSESVAKRFWPGEEALGKQIYLGAPDNRLFPDGVVVGVAADVKQDGLAEAAPETVYFPATLIPAWTQFSFALRAAAGDPESLVGPAREAVRQLDRAVPLFQVRSMDDLLAESVAPARSSMVLVGLFAALALVLAVLGVFGVLSYTVAQRTTELGIRLALGASARSVGLLVLGQGLLQVLAGVALGLAGSLALTRFLESLLFGVTPTDPLTFGAVALLLVGVAAVASYLPARRATRVDPMTVLRQE